MNDNDKLRGLPSVGALLEREPVRELVREVGPLVAKQAVREVVARARRDALTGAEGRERASTWSDEEIRAHAERLTRGTLVPVLNGTGVIVHTNLGRAPLATEAIEAMARVARGYATLEYDLDEGERGERASHARGLLTLLTGAEDSLVVNNNAAAVLLALACFAPGREVVVSRGELVEIGGGFRVPDVLAQSGARLVEVGTTNRTHLADYERAVGADTALLLKVHRSNFEIVGFTSDVTLGDLAKLSHARGLPLFYDAGSGALADMAVGEESVSASLRAGADLVMFSGDKLLGGPQAGIVVGRGDLIARLRRHPLMRALRPDKSCLAALHATLVLWATEPERVPVMRMLRTPVDDLEARGGRLARVLGGGVTVVESKARVGGGAAPSIELPSRALRIATVGADALADALRRGEVPVIARIEAGALLVDLRTIDPAADSALEVALRTALEGRDG